MKQFWEGLAAAVFFVLVGYVICLLANYDELIHPCPPCPEATTMGGTHFDSGPGLRFYGADSGHVFKPSFWELENMPFIDSMTIWTRAATIRVNGHYFRRGNRESGVWISRTPEEVEEMETFARHKELFRPRPMLIKGDKP